MQPQVCFIIAVSKNHVIGLDNRLPWRLRSDLQRFKRLTMGHPILMGRKTFESLPKVLPGRQSIVLTRNASFQVDHPNVQVISHIEQALPPQSSHEKLFVIGGAEIFQQFLPLATDLMLTQVLAHVKGDVEIPPFRFDDWILRDQEYVPMDDQNELPSRYEHWQRRS